MTPDTEEWEKEFDSLYLKANWMRLVVSKDLEVESRPIKSFIRSLLSSRDTYWKEELQKAREEERERIRTAITEKRGWTKNPNYHLEVRRRLQGNYLTEDIEPEALAQVTLEAEEVKIEEVLRLLTPITNEDNLK